MTSERPRLFERLKKGLQEGIEHERSQRLNRRPVEGRTLRVTEVDVPDPPQLYSADDVRRIRALLNMSQPGFAQLLQVSSKTVQSWEQGIRRPQQSTARLLQFIENPEMLTTVGQRKREMADLKPS